MRHSKSGRSESLRRPHKKQSPKALEVWTWHQIRGAQRILATEPKPPRQPRPVYLEAAPDIAAQSLVANATVTQLSHAQGVWRIDLDPALQITNRIPIAEFHSPPKSGFRDATNSLSAYRPQWWDQTFIPTVIPPRRPRTKAQEYEYDQPETVVDSYPWNLIGAVASSTPDSQTGSGGTGVLIGPNLVLTASHLVPFESDGSMQFTPAFYNTDLPFGTYNATRVIGYDPAQSGWDTAHDFAIFEIDGIPGWELGYMGWVGSSDSNFYSRSATWYCVGYPGGNPLRNPATEFNVFIEEAVSSGDAFEIRTPEFSSHGWSGGPLFGFVDGGPCVLGVLHGTDVVYHPLFSINRYTTFGGGPALGSLINWTRQNWGRQLAMPTVNG
jgi:hypothetical protein